MMDEKVAVPRKLVAQMCHIILTAPNIGMPVAAALNLHTLLTTCLQEQPGMSVVMEGDTPELTLAEDAGLIEPGTGPV